MKVALVGSAPSSRMLAPFHDDSWLIWACSPDNAGILPRVDLWFEIHGDLLWPENQSWAAGYIAWLNSQDFELYAQDDSIFPRAKTFPKDDLIERFGFFFFTSSFSWMIAFALAHGAKEIAMFGVDMATSDEYLLQRNAFQHFFTVAGAMGAKLLAPNESDILQPPPLYGYSVTTPIGRKVAVRERELTQKLELIQQQKAELLRNEAYIQGCIDSNEYFRTIWTGHQDHADDLAHMERAPADQSADGTPLETGLKGENSG